MDTEQLKNNKYFFGRYTDPGIFKGWIIGSFFSEDHPCKTDKVELLYKEHLVGDIEKPHYHKEKVELIIMLEGSARYNINGKDILLEKGNFLFIDVNNIIHGEFLKPSKIFVVHTPSLPKDKILIE
jgi:mannose-6-phosphate isomerase-like protein (cupin superfamily)